MSRQKEGDRCLKKYLLKAHEGLNDRSYTRVSILNQMQIQPARTFKDFAGMYASGMESRDTEVWLLELELSYLGISLQPRTFLKP